VLPLGIWTRATIAAGILYLLQYVAVKGALFLVAASVTRLEGTDDLDELGGLMRTRPWLGVAFLLPALALAGLPPTSGFVGKFLLVRAAFEAGVYWAGAVAVGVSLLTLLSMVKIFNGAFWGTRSAPAVASPARRPPGRGSARTLVGLPLAIGIATLVLGVSASGLLELATAAADALVDPSAYLSAVTR